MKLIKTIAYGLAAGVAMAALAMPAQAKVIGYSTLQISNFKIDSGADLINLSSVIVTNTTTTSADLNGTAVSHSDPVAGGVGNPVADSNALMSCVGTCAGIPQDFYGKAHVGNPTWTFARGDAILSGSLLSPGGATGSTVAETQLNGVETSSGNGVIQSVADLTTIEFTTTSSGTIVLSFDVFGELLAFSDEAGGSVLSDLNFSLEIRDLTNRTDVSFAVSGGSLADLTRSRAANGIQTDTYLVDKSLTLTVSGLLSDTRYRVQISQTSNVSAKSNVSEPASLGLLGLGLIGLATLATRRRKSA